MSNIMNERYLESLLDVYDQYSKRELKEFLSMPEEYDLDHWSIKVIEYLFEERECDACFDGLTLQEGLRQGPEGIEQREYFAPCDICEKYEKR